jgi:hypothetical protein
MWALLRLYSRFAAKNALGPSSSSHSFFECLQHAFCPDDPVRPLLHGRWLSDRGSRKRHGGRSLHSSQCLVRSFGHYAFTSLRPFAPPPLRGFYATMDALTPDRPALRARVYRSRRSVRHMNTVLTPFRSPCVISLHLPTIPSPTTPCRPDGLSDVFLHRAYRRTGRLGVQPCPFGTKRLGLRHILAGSPRQQAESSSRSLADARSYYGLVIRLRLLSTPPHGDAVTFSYEGPDAPRRGLPPRCCSGLTGALRQSLRPC